jgi:hypothetical protein
LLNPGKWGIVVDFVLEEKQLLGKDLLVDYDETDDISESRDGCLMIETSKCPPLNEAIQSRSRSGIETEKNEVVRQMVMAAPKASLELGLQILCDWSLPRQARQTLLDRLIEEVLDCFNQEGQIEGCVATLQSRP